MIKSSRVEVGISEFLPASLRMVLSSFCRALPLPKYLVAAVRAVMGIWLGNCLFTKSTRPDEAVFVRDLLFPFTGGDIVDLFIDSNAYKNQYNLINQTSKKLASGKIEKPVLSF